MRQGRGTATCRKDAAWRGIFTSMGMGMLLLLLLLASFYGKTDAVVPPSAVDATIEYYHVVVNTPVQGVPLYARPTIQAAAENFFRYPNLFIIHLFKVAKPGALYGLVVDVTSLGLEISATPLYSFQGHALFLGAPKALASVPLRALPCLRAHSLTITVSPSGKSSDYRALLANITTELLHFKAAGINLDLYKVLAVLPVQYLLIGCSYLSVFDELAASLQSLQDDLSVFEISDVTALVRYKPLLGVKASCSWRGWGFPYLPKNLSLGF